MQSSSQTPSTADITRAFSDASEDWMDVRLKDRIGSRKASSDEVHALSTVPTATDTQLAGQASPRLKVSRAETQDSIIEDEDDPTSKHAEYISQPALTEDQTYEGIDEERSAALTHGLDLTSSTRERHAAVQTGAADVREDDTLERE